MPALDVINGTDRWSIEQADCLDWLRQLPEGSVDLVFGSPPYEEARLYLEAGQNLDVSRKTADWVAWMVEVYKAAQVACKGLVAFVVAGQTRNYKWSAGPALLIAELHRSGMNLRNPPIFSRVGIPGSGGPDWLRGDYEWIVCTSRPGKLPWSDNTAMGHPPKWAPGGEMSHRVSDGSRVNQWGHPIDSGATQVAADGVVTSKGKRPSHRRGTATSGRVNGDNQTVPGHYDPPAKANPGNIVECGLSFEDWMAIISDYGYATKTRPREVLRCLRQAVDQGTLPVWLFGVSASVLGAEALRSSLYGFGRANASADLMPRMQGDIPAQELGDQILQPTLPGECQSDQASGGEGDRQRTKNRPAKNGAHEASSDLSNLWPGGEEVQSLWAFVRQTLPALQEVWRSTPFSSHRRAILPCLESSGLIECIVGGGVMGDDICHKNEAPFPEKLAEFFVLSFAPPDGIVADCFSGSGTSVKVAVANGRRAIACDLRPSQVKLTERRLQSVTPGMFT